jgi:hypothetical protein
MPDSDDSSLFSDSSEEGVPERDPVEFARSVWNEYGDDHTMIAALLGEEAVRDGPPVLQAARTRTTRDIQRDNQGDTEMQDAPGAGDNAGDAPNPRMMIQLVKDHLMPANQTQVGAGVAVAVTYGQ